MGAGVRQKKRSAIRLCLLLHRHRGDDAATAGAVLDDEFLSGETRHRFSVARRRLTSTPPPGGNPIMMVIGRDRIGSACAFPVDAIGNAKMASARARIAPTV